MTEESGRRHLPRVVHVCETVRGGVATYLCGLHRASTQCSESVFVIPLQQCEQRGLGASVATFSRRGRGIWAVVSMCLAARRAISRKGPDILFFHGFFAAAAMLAARLAHSRTRLVYCAHGWAALRYAEGSFRFRVARLVEARICALADLVVNISRHELAFAARSGYPGRHILIENAVRDVASGARLAARDAGDGRIRLLFVGRFDRQKGLDILLSAFRRVVADRPDLELHVVGEAVLGDHAPPESVARVVFHGWVGDDRIDAFYRSADALVVPSRWEGFGLVVAEAFRNGTPVIASDRGALPEIVEPGRNGIRFPLGIETLAEILRHLDGDELARLRVGARATYESRFTLDRLRGDMLAAYAAVQQDDRRGAPESARNPSPAFERAPLESATGRAARGLREAQIPRAL